MRMEKEFYIESRARKERKEHKESIDLERQAKKKEREELEQKSADLIKKNAKAFLRK